MGNDVSPDKSHRQVLIERFTAYLTRIDRLEAVSPGSLAEIAITAPSTVNLEDKVIEAALNLCAVSGAHAIKLPIKNTTPPLFVTIGEAGSFAPSTVEAPKDFDAALERIDAVCLEVQILCDEFGIDPFEYLASDEAAPSAIGDTARLDWLQSQLKHGWGDGFAMHPLDGGAVYPRPWKKSLEAYQGCEPDLKKGTYIWQADIRTAIDEAMRRSDGGTDK